MQDTIKKELTEKLSPRGIIIEDVLLKDILLPAQLSEAIEAKVKAEQDSQRMEFVLAKEKQEAQRKAIEAQGIADFQRIVSTGISDELLRWKGVEATERLADSCNTKVVIMGNGKLGFAPLMSRKLRIRLQAAVTHLTMPLSLPFLPRQQWIACYLECRYVKEVVHCSL